LRINSPELLVPSTAFDYSTTITTTTTTTTSITVCDTIAQITA
jgi:hypothetical protein